MNNSPETKAKFIQVIILVIGILIGLLLGLLLFKNKDRVETFIEDAERQAAGLQLTERQAMEAANLPTISVSNQPAGNTVTVDNARLTENGWIAVYTDIDGNPGSILGAQYFPEGTYENITVRLQAPTTAENTYYTIIHGDDGKIVETQFGRHQFDHTVDLPITDAEGNRIKDSFQTISLGARGL